MLATTALATRHAHSAAQFADPNAGQYGAVSPRPLNFPRDHGAHPEYRTEWWYLTGWLDRPGKAPPLGFQVTFFRARTSIDSSNPSAFAAKQLMIAHAAIADPARGSLLHDQRLARTGFGAASFSTDDTALLLDRWQLMRSPSGSYRSVIPARGFTLELEASPTQPLLLQGDAGYSRKGQTARHASYYYSQPQLSVRARLAHSAKTAAAEELTGQAWLDHEWSSTLLSDQAAGWDWIGMNLDDGSALTAFSIRPVSSPTLPLGPPPARLPAPLPAPLAAPLHAYASLRPRGAGVQTFGPDDVRFSTLAEWSSPRTQAIWPIAREIRIGRRIFTTQPLLNDQELDSRLTTGAVYWEGASRLLEDGRQVGRGYLEMTGYVAPLRL
ncbi:MAG: carotenoid 1,2-hydratase [Burkholderiaceae bacterium]|nr:carotenoid 1,2-hydratase [Burkholderiaceae bacterium]